MRVSLCFLLAVLSAAVLATEQSLCRKDVYALLAPMLSTYAPAQSFCSKKFPVPAVTSIVKAVNRRDLLGRGLLPAATRSGSNEPIEHAVMTTNLIGIRGVSLVVTPTTTKAPSVTSTAKANAKEVAWSSLVMKAGSALAQLCTCIATPKTIWIDPVSTTTTKSATISTLQTSSSTGAVTTSTSTLQTTTSKPTASTSTQSTTSTSKLDGGSSSTTNGATTSTTLTTTTSSSAASPPTVADGQLFQVSLSIDTSGITKRATSYVGIVNGQLVLVSTAAQGASFTVRNGALLVSGGPSAVGHASDQGTLPLTVYSSTGALPVKVTWTIGAGNALTLASGSLCVSDNTIYTVIGQYTIADCQRVTAQADATGFSVTTTTTSPGQSPPTPGWQSNAPPSSTPTCSLPLATSLVQNPSFEDGPSPDLAPWACTGTGATCRVSSGTYAAHQGSRVGLFTQVSNNGMTISQPFDLSCVPYGKSVTVSIWVKPLTLDYIDCCGKFCSMSILWDTFQTTNYGAYKPVEQDDGTYTWFQHSQTVPSNQKLNSLRVNWNCPGTFLVDDLTVTYS